jgi:uncharacterized membrane protein
LLQSKIKNPPITGIARDYTFFFIKVIMIFLVFIWILGFMQPILFTQNDSLTNYFLKRIYSPVCHQEINKCINIANHGMFVCARCAGIYFGALVASITALLFQIPYPKLKHLLIAVLPLFFDVIFSSIGIYPYSKILACGTGLIFGYIVFLFLLNEIENFFTDKSIKRNE